ncbi:MAG: hypothetical protein UX80_C0018G0008 [Candidatus Amesbacteria bacterium GW2011_GWA2_47_11b]|uniref:Helicase HerA central domain-containing protein n=1 Tax=Candidatus Amesbacteria bacterium GW2011_GWA2_47_11b TaxID=1618358 RepID=A0A0G1RJ55_9BACT|nr:MAG: hypothetical protein UX42_C0018G0006 [Microgenomates group bacterium GW2011_GWC1_46_20]KKU57354.1 MAG: hypothetical protein UX80_C0018G0008 [Candidatus Amesbacteria bacterium GW2011_GWA2_47_11b]
MALSVLSLKVPRESESSPEHTAQLLASLTRSTLSPSSLQKLFGKKPLYVSLEITTIDSQINFCVALPSELVSFVQSQLSASYPNISITPIPDYLSGWPITHALIIRQSAPAYFPIRDYADYKQIDPLVPILGVLAKSDSNDKVLVQFIISPPSSKVTKSASWYLAQEFELTPDGKPVRELPPEEKAIIKDKMSHPLANVSIRLASSNPALIKDLTSAISTLNRPDGNSLIPAKLFPWQKSRLLRSIRQRHPCFLPSTLNTFELASLWHLPGTQIQLPNIAWASSVAISEAPEDLPVSDKANTTFFAKTAYKNTPTSFGILNADRLRHMYVLGKSGTGKSTLLENMAVDDFKKGRGVAFIDPHGDSVDNLLNYIPSSRINDTIYFNPSDREHPISLNILETANSEQSELVVSGIISIFHKLYGKFWGPRMQYILRNALLTLTQVPNSTLPDVIKILSDLEFRQKIYPQISNKSLLTFWKKEFDSLDDETRLQYTYPILNKVGQFVNSPLIQNIISSPHSTINLTQVMNSGQIFLANLSQGKLGEDNATLLGAMLITKFELAALNRIDTPAASRSDFFLYVDEFQNFATESFIKILSEARKFHLGLVLANQYIAQVPETIQKAIFGNVGTIACFNVGAEDARLVSREFSPVFDEASLVNLDQHQIALKMTIDGKLSRPFSAHTLPPLKSTNQNRGKVISESRRRHSHK